MSKKPYKIIAFILCFLLLFEQSGFAQVAGELDISGHILRLSSSFTQDKFRPLHLRYLSYDNLNNNFKLLLDKGDYLKGLSPIKMKGLSPKGTDPEEEFKEETKTLLNYFFVGITLPNESFWVNLRPDSPENIIDDALVKTDVGKILLEADLQLKKDTAKFTSPQTLEGKAYWDKLYKKAEELFGSSNITIPTLTRPWIVPDEIIIRESNDNAYIYKATLKVMLEQDYLKDSAAYNFKDGRLKALNEYSSQLIRELIIPKLAKEINISKRYAPLRQVYYSLIMAQWFKQRFYGKGGLYSWLIDKKNLNGLTSKASWAKTTYFKEYQKSFKDGEYNLQVPVSTLQGQTIRSYFSGGIALQGIFGEAPSQPLPVTTTSSPVLQAGPSTIIRGQKSSRFLDRKRNGIEAEATVMQPTAGNPYESIEIKVGGTQEEAPSPATSLESQATDNFSSPANLPQVSPVQKKDFLNAPKVISTITFLAFLLMSPVDLFANIPKGFVSKKTAMVNALGQMFLGKPPLMSSFDRAIKALNKTGIDTIEIKHLVALMFAESDFVPRRSRSGAEGILQIMPSTVEKLKKEISRLKSKDKLYGREIIQLKIYQALGITEHITMAQVMNNQDWHVRVALAVLAENFAFYNDYKIVPKNITKKGKVTRWQLAPYSTNMERTAEEVKLALINSATAYNLGNRPFLNEIIRRFGLNWWRLTKIRNFPDETIRQAREFEKRLGLWEEISKENKGGSKVAIAKTGSSPLTQPSAGSPMEREFISLLDNDKKLLIGLNELLEKLQNMLTPLNESAVIEKEKFSEAAVCAQEIVTIIQSHENPAIVPLLHAFSILYAKKGFDTDLPNLLSGLIMGQDLFNHQGYIDGNEARKSVKRGLDNLIKAKEVLGLILSAEKLPLAEVDFGYGPVKILDLPYLRAKSVQDAGTSSGSPMEEAKEKIENMPEVLGKVIKAIKELEEKYGEGIVVVYGGAVRDAKLGRPELISDVDILIRVDNKNEADAIFKALQEESGLQEKMSVDLIGFYNPSTGEIEPVKLKEEEGAINILEQAIGKFDVSFDTMWLRSDGKIVDLHGGLKDLRIRVIRFVGKNPNEYADPLTVLRALRHKYRYGFQLGKETQNIIENFFLHPEQFKEGVNLKNWLKNLTLYKGYIEFKKGKSEKPGFEQIKEIGASLRDPYGFESRARDIIMSAKNPESAARELEEIGFTKYLDASGIAIKEILEEVVSLKKTSAGSPLVYNIFAGEKRALPREDPSSLQADSDVCLAVAAYNTKTGERFMAHFLPSGHLGLKIRGLAKDAKEAKQLYIQDLLKHVSESKEPQNWRVMVISSNKDLERKLLEQEEGDKDLEKNRPYALIYLEDLQEHLEKIVGKENILEPHKFESAKTVILDNNAEVKIEFWALDRKLIDAFNLNKPQHKSASSAIQQPVSSAVEGDEKGGIDMRALPIVRQTVAGSPIQGKSPIPFRDSPLRGQSLNLDAEWREIESMLNAGIIPSTERIKEYLQACCNGEGLSREIDKVLAVFADILRLEEERVSSTEPVLKELLALLESDKPANEIQMALVGITVFSREPKALVP